MSSPSEPDPRIFFAAERTLLAWIRTGLALMALGFVVARFGMLLRELAALDRAARSSNFTDLVGVSLVGLGVLVTGIAAASHVVTVRRLRRGEPFVGEPSWLGIALAAVLVLAGVAMTVYLGLFRDV